MSHGPSALVTLSSRDLRAPAASDLIVVSEPEELEPPQELSLRFREALMIGATIKRDLGTGR